MFIIKYLILQVGITADNIITKTFIDSEIQTNLMSLDFDRLPLVALPIFNS